MANETISTLATIPLEVLISEIKSRAETAVVLCQLRDENPRTIASFCGHPYAVMGMLASYLAYLQKRDLRLWEEDG